MSKKYTRETINKMAREIIAWIEKNRDILGNDWSLFWNGKAYYHDLKRMDSGSYGYVVREKDGVDPLEFCPYFPEKFVAGMAYDGDMYEFFNSEEPERLWEQLGKLLGKYGLYAEHADSCHCAFVPIDDIDDYEYYQSEMVRPRHIYTKADAPDEKIAGIMNEWYRLSGEVGDKGACVIGEYLEFIYKGCKYQMSAQSPWQGNLSWEEPLPQIRRMLSLVGATEIYYHCGRLD